MTTTPLLPPGAHACARVAYRACREDVEPLLAQGYSVRSIYEHLKAQGRAPCSYSAFCDYVRGKGQRKHSRKPKAGTMPHRPLATPPIVPTVQPERSKFLKPSDVDPATLF